MSEDFREIFGDWDPSRDSSDDRSEEEGPPARELDEKEVHVLGVFEHPDPEDEAGAPRTFVLLEDGRERKIPIWIGRYEAFAISTAIEREQLDRPMTHDLLNTVIERLDAAVDHAIIDDLWKDTFYAKLILHRGGKAIEIDCRPSDAIAVVLRARGRLFVAEPVFQTVAPGEPS